MFKFNNTFKAVPVSAAPAKNRKIKSFLEIAFFFLIHTPY